MEHDLWDPAGVAEGAVVTGVGCGPGTRSLVLAELVGRRDSPRVAEGRSGPVVGPLGEQGENDVVVTNEGVAQG